MGAVLRIRRVVAPCIVVAVALLAAPASQAAFLRDVPQTLTQPDGSVVHLFATGDEYYNRLHDANGFTVVRDPETGYLVYAIKADGRLQPTGFVVGRDDPAAAGIRAGLLPDPWTLPPPEAQYPMGRGVAVRALGANAAPVFSKINNLVIFISFADETTPSFNGIDLYQSNFNTSSSALKQYFLEDSYGQLTIDTTFYPAPSGNTVVSYKDSHPRGYYQPYVFATNPGGYRSGQQMQREYALIQAAVNGVGPQVPGSLDLDTNNDGFVDSVVFVVSGTANNADWANLLWPHYNPYMDYVDYPATINGKLVGYYDLQLDGNIYGSSVLCHEMTHTLGAPDLYHYTSCSSQSGLNPVGKWDLMADNLNPPQHATEYLKWRYLGFRSDIPLITPPATVTLSPVATSADNCARIASPNSPTEYFVVEYRKASGNFERSLPKSGLLVYRVDTVADGQGDACGPPDEVYVYRPSGTVTRDGYVNAAPFDGGAVPPRATFNDTTDPSSFLSTGDPGGLSIRNIGAAGGDTITFTVDAVAPCDKPGAFSLTSPIDGEHVASAATATLAWDASAGAASYDVYFGTSPTPPMVSNQTGTSLTVNVVTGATYFWYVVARNSCSQTPAPASGTWAFAVGQPGSGITLLADDFESGLSKWQVEPATQAGVDTMWGIVGCRTKSGHGAAWCAAGGSAPQPPCTLYAPNEGTFMFAGPFSLVDAADGTWDFDLWTDIDDGGTPSSPPDAVYWMWSLDGMNFNGTGVSGQSGGWQHVTVNMRDMKTDTGTPVLGQGQVWFAFIFVSDAVTQREGAYIDNVAIKKLVKGQPNFDSWLPAVIHKPGASDSQWRSDVAALNRSGVAGTLTLNMYAPSGTKTMAVPIGANAQVLLRDVAAQLGVTSESGALEVASDVDVFLTGRTYNQADATHTFGQDYEGAAPGDLLSAGSTAWLPQLTENALYRTNVGVTNTGTTTANVTVTLYDASGNAAGWTRTKDYAPGEFYQYQQPYLAVGGIDSGYAVVTVNSGSGVVAYASVIDNNTQDPTTINMKTGAPGTTGPFSHWLPAVIHKPGASDSQWRSDVAALNRSGVAGTLTLNMYAPSGTKTMAVPIGANAQVLLRDVAAQLGVTSESGALEVASDVDVFLTGRTYNQADATHTFGQDYEGAAPGDLLSAGGTAWLPQLTENALYRTNVGVTNTGTTTASVTVTLYDSGGNQVGTPSTRSYAPGSFYQYQQPYLAVGGIDSGYAVVTVNSGSGVVAYASVIDNNTQDPTTINMKR